MVVSHLQIWLPKATAVAVARQEVGAAAEDPMEEDVEAAVAVLAVAT